MLPWLIHVDPIDAYKAHTNFDTKSYSSVRFMGGYVGSSGAQNAERTWDVTLAKGTWTIQLIYMKDGTAGVFSVQIDTVEVGTVDAYNAVNSYNNVSDVTGIAVASTGKKELKLKMATKHASASSYVGNVQSITLLRTA